ncbi:ATG17 [Sanghuangporus sanghuang]
MTSTVLRLPPPSPNQSYCDVSAVEAGFLTIPGIITVTNVDDSDKHIAPSLTFLITHAPSGKRLLFDLGLNLDEDCKVVTPGCKESLPIFDPFVPKDVVASLKAGGVNPDDVTHICISHLHFDHVGNPDKFQKARFLVGEGSRGLMKSGYPENPKSWIHQQLLPEDRTDFLDTRSSDWKPIGPFERAFDYFGDGSLYIIDAPGHLPGHLNILARTSADGGWIYLAGDSAHDWRLVRGQADIAELKHPVQGMTCMHGDPAQARATIRKIRELTTLPRVRVVLAHDNEWYEENKNGNAFWPVLHSKKALQHGEQLCSQAHVLTHATSGHATDLLALDAKARWVAQGILEQLKLAEHVARTIELQRSRLEDQAKEWDKARSFHAGSLDNILESLERQVVPPDFHLSSSSSSLFGGIDSGDSEGSIPEGTREPKGDRKQRNTKTDRSKWKSLRDFVDFGSIVKATEEMDEDRDVLEDILSRTEGFSLSLSESVESLRTALPTSGNIPSIQDILTSQEIATSNMANQLEGLASHYEQMRAALEDKEAGIELNEEDLEVMNRDTDELPSIIAELEQDVANVKSSHDQLLSAKTDALRRLDKVKEIVAQLDELEGVMSDMLLQQQTVETEYETQLESLQQHLTTLEHLCITYTQYETSFNSLLLELERRRRYRDAAEEIVRGMARQLDAMRNEETQVRETFFTEHGGHLPEDLCSCIGNVPTKWEVGPAPGEIHEELPVIDEDLIVEATRKMDLVRDGTDSV